jgi:two-component system, LytTR family, sensor kinase
MFTLDPLRSNRNALFWTLHAGGWGAYAVAQYFGALLYEKSFEYQLVIGIAAVAGFVLSMPMRYIYRGLFGKPIRVVVFSVLATCYITSLALRIIINYSYKLLVEPDWQFKTMFELFAGAVSMTFLLGCWSAIYFGVKYFEYLQRQREAALRSAALAQEAQLKMLRYQLNPHFLFNTLNAISTLILDNQNRTANHAVTRLSEFLRYTLDQDPMKKVTLRQEIEALDLYMNTERLRFGGRLRLEYAVEEPALDALVPSLLLQPLIENAVKYAITPREEGGSIRIEGRTRGAMLELTVIDDGPGLRDGNALIEGRGVGLRNSRERLAVLYGERHRFAVLNSHPGVRIEIGFPLEKATLDTMPAATKPTAHGTRVA